MYNLGKLGSDISIDLVEPYGTSRFCGMERHTSRHLEDSKESGETC